MVIVSNIYEVAIRSYSLFSTEMQKTVSFGIYRYKEPCLHPLRKTHVTDDSRLLWLSNHAETVRLALLNPSMCIHDNKSMSYVV